MSSDQGARPKTKQTEWNPQWNQKLSAQGTKRPVAEGQPHLSRSRGSGDSDDLYREFHEAMRHGRGRFPISRGASESSLPRNAALKSSQQDVSSVSSGSSFRLDANRDHQHGISMFFRWFRRRPRDSNSPAQTRSAQASPVTRRVPISNIGSLDRLGYSSSASTTSVNEVLSTASSFTFLQSQREGPSSEKLKRKLQVPVQPREGGSVTLRRKYGLHRGESITTLQREKDPVSNNAEAIRALRREWESQMKEAESRSQVSDKQKRLSTTGSSCRGSFPGRKKRPAPPPPESHKHNSNPTLSDATRAQGACALLPGDRVTKHYSFIHVPGKRKAPSPPSLQRAGRSQSVTTEPPLASLNIPPSTPSSSAPPASTLTRKKQAPSPPKDSKWNDLNSNLDDVKYNCLGYNDSKIHDPSKSRTLHSKLQLYEKSPLHLDVPNVSNSSVTSNHPDATNSGVTSNKLPLRDDDVYDSSCPRNDILKLEGGILRPISDKAHIQSPQGTNGILGDNGRRTLPLRPWYKRHAHVSPRREQATPQTDKRKWKENFHLEEWMPDVSYYRRSVYVNSLAPVSPNPSLNTSPKARRTLTQKDGTAKSDYKRLSLLTNISELDREAAEIIQKEKERQLERKQAEDAKFYEETDSNKNSLARTTTTEGDAAASLDQDEVEDDPPKKASAKELINMFNALNSTRVTVNASYLFDERVKEDKAVVPPAEQVQSHASVEAAKSQTEIESVPVVMTDLAKFIDQTRQDLNSPRTSKKNDKTPSNATSVGKQPLSNLSLNDPKSRFTSSNHKEATMINEPTKASQSSNTKLPGTSATPLLKIRENHVSDKDKLNVSSTTTAAAPTGSALTTSSENISKSSVSNQPVSYSGGARPKTKNYFHLDQVTESGSVQDNESWSCSVCTLMNKSTRLWCEACSALKPRKRVSSPKAQLFAKEEAGHLFKQESKTNQAAEKYGESTPALVKVSSQSSTKWEEEIKKYFGDQPTVASKNSPAKMASTSALPCSDPPSQIAATDGGKSAQTEPSKKSDEPPARSEIKTAKPNIAMPDTFIGSKPTENTNKKEAHQVEENRQNAEIAVPDAEALRKARLAFFASQLNETTKIAAERTENVNEATTQLPSQKKEENKIKAKKVSSACQTTIETLRKTTRIAKRCSGKTEQAVGVDKTQAVRKPTESMTQNGSNSFEPMKSHDFAKIEASLVTAPNKTNNHSNLSTTTLQLSQFLQQREKQSAQKKDQGSSKTAHEGSTESRANALLVRLEEAIALGQFDKAAVLAKELAAIKRTPTSPDAKPKSPAKQPNPATETKAKQADIASSTATAPTELKPLKKNEELVPQKDTAIRNRETVGVQSNATTKISQKQASLITGTKPKQADSALNIDTSTTDEKSMKKNIDLVIPKETTIQKRETEQVLFSITTPKSSLGQLDLKIRESEPKQADSALNIHVPSTHEKPMQKNIDLVIPKATTVQKGATEQALFSIATPKSSLGQLGPTVIGPKPKQADLAVKTDTSTEQKILQNGVELTSPTETPTHQKETDRKPLDPTSKSPLKVANPTTEPKPKQADPALKSEIGSAEPKTTPHKESVIPKIETKNTTVNGEAAEKFAVPPPYKSRPVEPLEIKAAEHINEKKDEKLASPTPRRTEHRPKKTTAQTQTKISQFTTPAITKTVSVGQEKNYLKNGAVETTNIQTEPNAEKMLLVDVYIEDRLTQRGPFTLPVKPDMPLKELKTVVQDQLKVPADMQRWILGKQLAADENLTLTQYNINMDHSSLYLYLVAPEPAVPKPVQPKNETEIDEKETGRTVQHTEPQKNRYYNYEADRYSSCDESDSDHSNHGNENNGLVEKSLGPETDDASTRMIATVIEVRQKVTVPDLPPNIDGWICGTCTLFNPGNRPGCEACASDRPADYQPVAQNPTGSSSYNALVNLEQSDIVPNGEEFDCPVCMMNVPPGTGVTLRDCLHTFCKDCLAHLVEYSNDAVVHCPYRDNNYACDSALQEREIKALVKAEVYEKHLERSMNLAEKQMKNAFHCQTANCSGWCIIEDNVNIFRCPVCRHTNCLTCQAIHEGVNCKEYQDRVTEDADSNEDARRTKEMIDALVRSGEALECPQCQVVLMKRWGCDWVRCSVCRTEICWVTRGRRWGEKGKGDTSGGCRCGVNGVKCHPQCNYCH